MRALHRRRFAVLVLAAACAAAGAARAHVVADPKFGGVVVEAGDLDFELVVDGDTATLYVEDHGELFATEGASGRLTVVTDGVPAEVALEPEGPNKLVGRGVRLEPGARVMALVVLRGWVPLLVRYPAR